MAKIIFKGVPDFTEVRAEIAKLKQEVASVSSTKVNLNGTAQGLNGAANAAGGYVVTDRMLAMFKSSGDGRK